MPAGDKDTRDEKRRKIIKHFRNWIILDAGWAYFLVGGVIGIILSTISKALGW